MIDYKVHKHIATISENGENSKRLCLISYNGAAPKLDLRGWKITSDGVKMLKGLTLTEEEALALRDALTEYFRVS